MNRVNQLIEEETNSRAYKFTRFFKILKEDGGCTKCHPNKGCNRHRSSSATRSWKTYRSTQWK